MPRKKKKSKDVIRREDRERKRKKGIENQSEIQTNPISERKNDTNRQTDSVAMIPPQNNVSIDEERLEEEVQMYIRTHPEDELSKYVEGSNEFSQFDHPQEQTRTHIRTHTGEMFHNCDLCGKEFLSRYDLQIHMRSHTGFKPYKCLICCEEFSVKSSFILHTRRHQAGKKYKSLDLKMHITTHAVDEQTNYDGCSNAFTQLDHPQEHTRMLPILKTEEIFHNCGICCKEFCSKDDLQKHMRSHTEFKPFKCLICGEDFSVISSFRIHMRSHKEKGDNSSGHKGDNPSGVKGNNSTEHKEDNSSGHNGNNPSGHKGDNPSDLQMYFTTHAVDKQSNYEESSNEFSQLNHSREQTRMLPILKTEEIFHNCGICGKEFCSRDDLQKHMRIHTEFKPFKCLICGEDFSVISSFKIHMRRHKEKGNNSSGHKGDNPSVEKDDNSTGDKEDNSSGDKGNNSSDLQINKRTHAGDEQRNHEECSNEFSQVDHPHGQRRVLITHIRTQTRTITRTHPLLKTGKLFHDCDICGKEFISKSSLREHIRSHTGFKPYKCGICGKDFRVKSSVNYHMKIHEKKPYICDVCSTGFTSSQRLDKHMRTHTGDDFKPYTCDHRQRSKIEKHLSKRQFTTSDEDGSSMDDNSPKYKRKKLEKGSDEYVMKRVRNNTAVKKCREKSRQKANKTMDQVDKLRMENETLKQKVTNLSKDTQHRQRSKMEKHLSKRQFTTSEDGSSMDDNSPKYKRKKLKKGSDEYVMKRVRNNTAVKKCREKSQQKANETMDQVDKLRKENEALKQKVTNLSKEIGVMKNLLLAHAGSVSQNEFSGNTASTSGIKIEPTD
ncbi:uncharacterized protein LOC143051588 isoform X1 [Mytilus galloprovincialis]|uniref:uncharacterized protein LOC143051588 isoform X1 n=1 Tax=Mytilus galloprovincialis TaxID=29158 RepID=UPI003F7C243E